MSHTSTRSGTGAQRWASVAYMAAAAGAYALDLATTHAVVDRRFCYDLANSRILTTGLDSPTFLKRTDVALEVQEPGRAPLQRSRMEVYEYTGSHAQRVRRRVAPSFMRP